MNTRATLETSEKLFAGFLPDQKALLAQLRMTLSQHGSAMDKRSAATEALKEVYDQSHAQISTTLRANPWQSQQAIEAYSDLTDSIVTCAFDICRFELIPNPNPTSAEHLAVIAVGGYGRAEMAPYSDVDLLFLTPWKQTAWGESIIEYVLYILWDLKMKVGHAVRTVDDCIRLGKSDLTIRTALLEHRFLAGQQKLARELRKRLWDDLFSTTGPEFLEAKLEERDQRHKRNGGARYVVEPNVKEGKGGLRDLQTLYWIAKYLNNVQSPDELVEAGVFTADEFQIFCDAESFLWTTRCQLHLFAKRPAEQMTFDAQVDIAANLGYEDTEGRRGVEMFMQDYFSRARGVGELTRIFLTDLEAKHIKSKPTLKTKLLKAFVFSEPEVADGFLLRNGRLDYEDPDCIQTDPVNILRLFKEGLASGNLIHPLAMRNVTANLDLIDDRLRNDKQANELFFSTLLDHNNPERALRRMNELGVLGAFIPEFGRIVAMMQFNMYHHYTVDEHTIQCVSNLAKIEHGDLIEELPIASAILSKGVNRKVLYTALLLHDIGKGLPEDHSIAGAKIAESVAPRLGLNEDDAETVIWLVENHLLMSDFAQKRDVSDPRTVALFAEAVNNPSRLKLLTVLTVCDIRGVGPGVWNNWKAMLLRELYALTLAHLTGDTSRTRPERVAEAKEAFANALSDWPEDLIETELDRHYDPFWLGLDTEIQVEFANLLQRLKPSEPISEINLDESRDATRACFVMHDHPGIFSRLAGGLALAGANVVDARTYTTSDGIATPVFWLQDKDGKPFERGRLTRLRNMIAKTLRGDLVAREALTDRDREKKRERDFIVPTDITFDNDGSEIFTIIEVDTRDRPGLLHDLTRALAANNVTISSAIIATYGKQAVDTFYVKDLFGLKIHAKTKQDRIEERLRVAIEEGFERSAP